jgi:hypothetical protein
MQVTKEEKSEAKSEQKEHNPKSNYNRIFPFQPTNASNTPEMHELYVLKEKKERSIRRVFRGPELPRTHGSRRRCSSGSLQVPSWKKCQHCKEMV